MNYIFCSSDNHQPSSPPGIIMLTHTSSTKLPKKTTNKSGHKAKLGTGPVPTGDTGQPASSLYYCGLPLNPCRCGGCPTKFCGPTDGCPCSDCVAILGWKVNSSGDLAKPGGALGDGGDTTMPPENLFYCGKWKMQCRCGTCDGQCGPLSGCPCHSCIGLVGLRVNRDGALCRKGVGQGVGVVGMKWCDLYYCGKRKMECRCGGECGERCGGIGQGGSGCPCASCLDLVTHPGGVTKGKFFEEEEAMASTSTEFANKLNISECEGANEVTTTTTSELPTAPEEGGEEEGGAAGGVGEECVICLERKKQYLLLPCGHYSYCAKCVGTVKVCAICRSQITTKVKVYET